MGNIMKNESTVGKIPEIHHVKSESASVEPPLSEVWFFIVKL